MLSFILISLYWVLHEAEQNIFFMWASAASLGSDIDTRIWVLLLS